MPSSLPRIRFASAALLVAGILFLLYPVFRPWENELTSQGALAAMGADAWLASHTFAMVGFLLLPLGLLAAANALAGTGVEGLARTGGITAWFGTGLTLPYYGAETFALHTLASEVAAGSPLDLVSLAEAIRYAPLAVSTFTAGLVLLPIGAGMTAVAIARSEVLPRASGLPLALGLAAFLPQFFTPPAVRIAHGALMAVGSIVLGIALWRAGSRVRRQEVGRP